MHTHTHTHTHTPSARKRRWAQRRTWPWACGAASVCGLFGMASVASPHSARPRRYVFGSLYICMQVSFVGYVKETYKYIQNVLWGGVGSKSALRTPAQVCMCVPTQETESLLHIPQKRHAYICSVNMMALVASPHSARPRRYVFGSLCISMPVSFGQVKETYKCIQNVL